MPRFSVAMTPPHTAVQTNIKCLQVKVTHVHDKNIFVWKFLVLLLILSQITLFTDLKLINKT